MAKFDDALKLYQENQSLEEVLNVLKNRQKLPGPVSDPLQDSDIFPYQPNKARLQMEQNMGGPLSMAETEEEPEQPELSSEEEMQEFNSNQNREPAGMGEIEQEDEIGQPQQFNEQPEISELEEDVQDIQKNIEPEEQLEQQEESPEQKAIRLAGENRVAAAIQRSTANVGEALASAGIGRKIQTDKKGIKFLEKGVDRPLEIFKFQREQEQISRDLQNAQKMADPNSDISKMTRSMLGQVGLSNLASQNISAQDLKNAGIDVDSLLAKKIQMDQTRALREQNISIREDARISDMAARLAPKVQNSQYDKMITLNNQVVLMKEFVENPNPQNDTAMIYAFVTALDPKSVVREGEIAFVQASRSIPTKFKSALIKGLKGESLTPEERKNIFEFAQHAANTQQKAWKGSASPYLEQAKRLNIPTSMILPGGFNVENPSSNKETLTDQFNKEIDLNSSFDNEPDLSQK